MARTNSKGSTSARSGPFLQTGPMPPPLLSAARHDNPAMEAWATQEQPLSSYTLSHQPHQLQRSISRRKSDLEQVPELENVGEDPATFLSRTGLRPALSLTPSPISMPSSMTPTRKGLSSLDTQQAFNKMPTPTTPTSDAQSLTTATTLTSNTMSRQNSLYNDSLLESIQMMKFNSNTSLSTDSPTDHFLYNPVTPHYPSRHTRRSSNEEQSQLLVGAGGIGHDSQFSHTFPSTGKYPYFQSPGSFGEKMEKSESNESASSTSSSASSRSKRVLAAQIELAAARPLKPKGGSDENLMSRDNSSQPMSRFESKDGLQDKIAISKPTYQRPKHDRVYCKACDDHPDGFRGEHELRRHQDRQHKKEVKKWVCITPASSCDLPQSTLKPVVLLSKCKACQQKKQYGAYYNAAAHLRRAHFRPKSRSRTKSNRKLEDSQKRGGKGGGDWPTMEELKPWMMEIEVLATDYNVTTSQEEEADVSDDDNYDNISDEPSSAHALSNLSGGAFENSHLITDATYAAYPSPNPNVLFGMQNMQYLDIPSQQTIDSSMCYSQNPFDPFVSFQNDHLAFENPLSIPQTFDDQLIGLEPVYSSFL